MPRPRARANSVEKEESYTLAIAGTDKKITRLTNREEQAQLFGGMVAFDLFPSRGKKSFGAN